MLSQEMTAALNKQLNTELYSAHLYLSMSSYASSIGLKGAANWFMIQYQEEMVHFMKFYTYINSQGKHVALGPLDAPPNEFPSLLAMFEETLKHEMFITRCINELTECALKEKNMQPRSFSMVCDRAGGGGGERPGIIGKLKLIGDNGYGILMLDNELGARVFTPPSPLRINAEVVLPGTGCALRVPYRHRSRVYESQVLRAQQGVSKVYKKLTSTFPKLDVKIKDCIKKCGPCHKTPFAVVDGKTVCGIDAEDLYTKIIKNLAL